MTVQKIIGEKGQDVTTVTPNDTIETAAKTLETHKIGAVVVADGSGGVAGILSERDIVKWIARQGADVLSHPVSELMTTEVVTCKREDTIAGVMGLMTRGKFRHVPVVEEDKLIGIISIGDVVKHRLAEAEFEAQAMRDYIATG